MTKILIIDDDSQYYRTWRSFYLQREGFQVEAASRGSNTHESSVYT